VLLIACANAAGLLHARSVARRRALGVRAALGASGGRLARQLLLEALAVAAAGAAAALLLARPAVRMLVGLAANVLPGHTEASFDYRVFLFLLLAAAATAGLAALAPILHLRGGLREELQAGGARGGADRGSRRLRSALVVSQVALSAVLLVGTGLLIKSLAALLAVDPGITTERVVSLRLAVAGGGIGSQAAEQHLVDYQRVLQRVQALPGIRAAGWTSQLPLRDWGWNGPFSVEGIAVPVDPAQEPFAERRAVSPGYFDALGIRVVRGRGFRDADDRGDAPPVAVVNQTAVRQYFHGLEPIGRRVKLGATEIPVAGVIADFRQTALDAPPVAEIYVPMAQAPRLSMTLVVRSQLPPEATMPMLRAAVAEVVPDLPVFDVQTMQEVVDSSLADRKLVMWLLAAFAGVALLLAATGLYGLLAYLVAQGRREIGIRMALGAARRAVLAMVVGQGSRLLAAGLAAGLVLGLLGARLLGDLLYGVRPADAATLLAVAVALTVVSLLALWVPARRALRVDPMTVLREDR
jgi:predicted permease